MTKQKFLERSLIIVVLTLVLYFGTEILNGDSQARPTVLRIGYNVDSINHAPIMVAADAGIFTKHKLNVELAPLKSGKEIQQALALGRIDIGSAGATNFFIPISKGAPVKIIAPSTLSPTYVFVRPDGGIKSFSDLNGKTIASRAGESSNWALRQALEKEGVEINSVQFLDIDKTLRPIALMEKKIVDAAVAGEYEDAVYKAAGAVIFDEWSKKNYINLSLPRTVIAVNTDFSNSNPKLIGWFIEAFIESQKYIKDNQDQAADMVSNHIQKGTNGAGGSSPMEIKEAWKGVKYTLWYDPSAFTELARLAKEVGDIEKNITLEQIMDLRFEKTLSKSQNDVYGKKD